MTIGLWHESMPSQKWQSIVEYDILLNGPNDNGKGFKSYATDYVNYVKNLINIGKTKGIQQGEFYFATGDPNVSPFQYLNPKPFPDEGKSHRPMINEYLIEPLAKSGVKKFGLTFGSAVNWVWDGTTGNLYDKLFYLINELNKELENSKVTQKSNKLYITYIGFDNEGTKEYDQINKLWENYQDPYLGKVKNWGVTGGSESTEVTKSNLGFVEYYNIPANYSALNAFDHPCFLPNANMWEFDFEQFAKSKQTENPQPRLKGDRIKYGAFNTYYGLNTPTLKIELDKTFLKRVPHKKEPTPNSDLLVKLYSQIKNPPTIKQIISGEENNTSNFSYPLINANDIVYDNKKLYDIYNSNKWTKKKDGSPWVKQDLGNWLTLAQDFNKPDKKPYIDISNKVRWMLNIASYSSAFNSITQDGIDEINKNTTDVSKFPIKYINVDSPYTSIGIKYQNNFPFKQNTDKTKCDLFYIQNTSGTFEAFGCWELDKIIDFMIYAHNNTPDTKGKKVVKNFMLYEFNFAKVEHCDPGYADSILNN